MTILVAVFVFASCSFGFLESGDLSASDGQLHSITFDIDGGYRVEWYDADEVLQYYEDFYTSDDLVAEYRRFDADGTLAYGYRYTYNASGDKTLTARYDSAGALSWFQVKTYASAGLVETFAEFGADSDLSWTRRYVYGSGATASLVELSASFDGGGVLDGAAAYTFDSSARPESMLAYGTVPCAVEVHSSVSGGNVAARPRAALVFSLPPIPAYTVPDEPDSAALEALGLTGRTYWLYDAYGTTEMSFDADFYPVSATRVDDRLEKEIRVELSWTDGLIDEKKTWYGTTLALDVAIEYADSGLPVSVSTSGASLLLPLDYSLTYDGLVPSRLTISSSGVTLQYFEYEYDGPALESLADTARSLDPFAVLGQLDGAGLSILHYDGDDSLVETFEFSVDASSLRVDVVAPGGSLNGYYLASYDSSDLMASLSAYDSNGASLWSYSYGYDQASSALSDAAADAGVDLGRLWETLSTGDVAEYASAFIVDLLF